jgi:cytosine/adenosine deaminase-related metal-dependent hydrolase
MTQTHEQARALARIAEEEDWCGEVHVFEDQKEIDRALGTGRRGYGLLSVWWD